MRNHKVLIGAVAAAAVTTTLVLAHHHATSQTAVVVATPSICHFRQVDPNDAQRTLPDPACTPGKVSITDVSRICPHANTKAIRPPASYTGALKRQQIVSYGYADTNPKVYEEDHLISLELGGDPRDPANLWPEPGKSINEKDTVENTTHALVCAGKLNLADAQHRIATDWIGLGKDEGVLR